MYGDLICMLSGIQIRNIANQTDVGFLNKPHISQVFTIFKNLN